MKQASVHKGNVRIPYMAVMLVLLLVSNLSNAQQPRRFPGLVYEIVDMDSRIEELLEQPDATPSPEPVSEDAADTASEAGPDQETIDSILGPLRESLLSIEESSGPYDAERLQALTDIANVYQDFGAHEEAVDTLEEVLQLQRIQDGLYSADQVSIIDEIKESHIALRDIDQADNMEALALHVLTRTYPEGSDVLTRRKIQKANWNIEHFLIKQLYLHQSDHYRIKSDSIINDNTGESSAFNILPGQVFYFGNSSSPDVPAISSEAFSELSYRLNEAEELLTQALRSDRLSEQEKINNLRLLAAIQWYREFELYTIYYEYKDLREDFMYLESGTAYSLELEFYRRGSSYLTGALEAVKSLPESTPADVANAMLDLADWDLVFYRHGEARKKYTEVYDYLKSEELPESEIAQIMNPSPLLQIPAFATHQYQLAWWQQDELQGNGFVELNATLRKTGRLISMDMSELSDPGESQYIRMMLRSHLQDGFFRPVIAEGEPTEQEVQQVMFEYSY